MTVMLRGSGADEFNEPGVSDIADAEDAHILVALETADRHRAEEFLRRRESSHQMREAPQPRAVLRADALGKTCD